MFLDFDFNRFAAFLDFYTNSLCSSERQFTGVQVCPGACSQDTMAWILWKTIPIFPSAFCARILDGSLTDGCCTERNSHTILLWFALTCLLSWTTRPGRSSCRTRDLAHGCVSAVHDPLTHYKISVFPKMCVIACQRNSERGRSRMTHISSVGPAD